MMNTAMAAPAPNAAPTLTTLPAEIRLAIFDYVFPEHNPRVGFRNHNVPTGLLLDDAYSASHALSLLLSCRQFYTDASLLAFGKIHFVLANLFADLPSRLATLHPKQQASLRHLAFTADARHFRRFADWDAHAFGLPQVNLDTLTVILHASTPWHYLFDHTPEIVQLLRRLRNVKRFIFVRNGARVKGGFRTWYNRLIGLIMKVDHAERYERADGAPNLEEVWWEWEFDEVGQRICLEAGPAREWVSDEGVYLEGMLPLMEGLRESVEREEWNPDPRSRMMYY